MLVRSSALLAIVASELTLFSWSLGRSLMDVLVPGDGKGELLKLIILSFLDPSEDDTMPDSICLS